MSEKKEQKSLLSISARSFLTAIIVIAILMVVGYVLTLVLPGCYIPTWKWLLSPVLVLRAEGGATIIAVIIFLLVIGGIFNDLDKCGMMVYMLDKIAYKCADKKYKFLKVVVFFFMAMGALIGSFEESIPLVPIVVGIALKLGWDPLTGLAMSFLAIGCGFSTGVFNPFTVGVAQELAGLPMFSGVWLRALAFVLIYPMLVFFITRHAKKVDKGVSQAAVENFEVQPMLDKALNRFVITMAICILIVLSSAFITVLQDYTLIIVALGFLVAGIIATASCKMPAKEFFSVSFVGVKNMLPAVLMILMASSIKYTLDTAGALDVILNGAISVAETLPKWAVILFIYLIVLVMNFFIASGSAKAFMLIPIIVPLAEVFGISAQLCVLAFAFGDGFSNTFYPTNPALLVGLGLADISYTDWAKWTAKFQIPNLVLTSALLLFGLAVGY